MARVLFVEDQQDLRELFQELIADRGHWVAVADDGEAALLALEDRAFDVAFVDIGLPGIDGFEVARRARALLGGRVPVLVAMTGYRPHANDGQPWDAFDAHLVKPVDVAQLVALVGAHARGD